MLCGYKPECICKAKTLEWCPFGQKAIMEENAINPGGILTININYPADKIDDTTKDLLSKLFEVNPTKRIGFNNIDEIKTHSYFKSINWEAVESLEVIPPFLPDSRSVNANSIAEVGDFNRSEYKKIKLTPEDQAVYKDFYYVNTSDAHNEIVTASIKIDYPDEKMIQLRKQKEAEANSNSCCVSM
jgi:serine/threonine protein kinase